MPCIKKCEFCGNNYELEYDIESRKFCSQKCFRGWIKAETKRKHNEKKNANKLGKMNMESIVEITMKAREMNMTYGQYIAKYGL